MERPRKRYLAGVCGALGLKYKINPIIIRILFIISSFFLIFPLSVYIVLCFTIPNYQKVNKKTKIKYGFLGGVSIIITVMVTLGLSFTLFDSDVGKHPLISLLLISGFLGALIQIIITILIISLLILLFVLGYVVGRSIAERKEYEIILISNKEN
jgi:phage shock protein PspC (stress-responsive transcriptional regulator)